ncbi:g9809 [Coccomyxa elongata]
MAETTSREVLIPGAFLPPEHRGEGRFHGVVTCIKRSGTAVEAFIAISDIRNVRIKLPWEKAQQFLLTPQPSESSWKWLQRKARSKRKPGTWHGLHLTAATAPLSKRASSKSSAEMQTRAAARPSKPEQAPRKRPRGRPGRAGTTTCAAVLSAAQPLPRSGAALLRRISQISQDTSSRWVVGTQLLAKVRGWKCHWPAVVWNVRLCLLKDMNQLLESYKQGRLLVRFYGERSMMWVREEDVQEGSLDDSHVEEMQIWGRLHKKPQLVNAVLEELDGACEEPAAEVERLRRLQRIYSTTSSRSCTICLEEDAELHCGQCQRALHTLCLRVPCLAPSDLPAGAWDCPCCGQGNNCQGDEAEVDTDEKVERMGLTPDWIIRVAALVVFQLPQPTHERPYIQGLLDPCTNSMIAPNIPAEVLYDKKMNGLLMSNSWAGYHILLNPDYSAATQWRFVNRAIDEVENDRVPAVLLVCRNSTDTAYFQRLRPYPRVMLRRGNARFKDYDKTPIGFGVAVFCIAKAPCKELYERFFDGFAAMGEPNIPIDKELMQSAAFFELLDRLKRHSEEHQRDHWIQCSLCAQWRIISYETLLQVRSDATWTCEQLRPGFSCRMPSSKRELAGARGYATINSAGQLAGDSEAAGPASTAAPPTYSTRSRQPDSALGPCAPAEAACAGMAAAVGSLDACASTSLDTVAGGCSGKAHAAQSAAGGAPCCSLPVPAESSRIGGSQAAKCELDPLLHTVSAATHQQCMLVCSNTVLQSVDSVAPVQSVILAEAPTQQLGERVTTVMTQQSVASEDTMTGEVKMQCEPTAPCLVAAAASSQTPQPLAAGAHADDSAGGSPCCESTAAPAWAWATAHETAATSVSVPVVALCEEHAGTCGDRAHTAVLAEAFEGHLQAALRLQPLHVPVCSLDLEEDEVQQLSAIELARNARIAANRAFFASMSASYAPGGDRAGAAERASLPVDHPLVLAAARELAEKAALEQARMQVETAERLWETGRRVRSMKAAELRAQLAAIEEQQGRAAELLRSSKATYSRLAEEYGHKTA